MLMFFMRYNYIERLRASEKEHIAWLRELTSAGNDFQMQILRQMGLAKEYTHEMEAISHAFLDGVSYVSRRFDVPPANIAFSGDGHISYYWPVHQINFGKDGVIDLLKGVTDCSLCYSNPKLSFALSSLGAAITLGVEEMYHAYDARVDIEAFRMSLKRMHELGIKSPFDGRYNSHLPHERKAMKVVREAAIDFGLAENAYPK